jgi:hypothetical protein
MKVMRSFFLALFLLLPVALSAADQQAVNTVCPVTGKPVDTTIPAVIVTVGKGERAQRIPIGVADRAAADKVKADPSAYVEAAKANRKAK